MFEARSDRRARINPSSTPGGNGRYLRIEDLRHGADNIRFGSKAATLIDSEPQEVAPGAESEKLGFAEKKRAPSEKMPAERPWKSRFSSLSAFFRDQTRLGVRSLPQFQSMK